MNQNLWCRLFNLHKYEIIKEETVTNSYDIKIGIVVVSRCTNCGKVKYNFIPTKNEHNF